MRTSLPYTLQNCFAAARDEAEITSLTNNDVYKFLMLDFILAHEKYRDLEVQWTLKIRTPGIRIADIIPEEALREQLAAARAIKGVNPADLGYLRGMVSPSGRPLLREPTLDFLKDFQLPDYELENDGEGGYDLRFMGPWSRSTMWEIVALKIVNTLFLYHYNKKVSITTSEFNGMMTRQFARLYDDIDMMKRNPDVPFTEFGTRRSMSTDVHRMVLEILQNELPESQFLGSSNVMLSREFGQYNPRGTNAHELRMIPTALVDQPQDIIDTMYQIDREWMAHNPELAILLPDTFGSTFYYENAPRDIIEGHKGARLDSKDPLIAVPEYVNFLLKNDLDPANYITIPSDGQTAKSAIEVVRAHSKKIGRIMPGIGTSLTNNTKGLMPANKEIFGPYGSMSIVLKPTEVYVPNQGWKSTVKLTDNFTKGISTDPARLALFRSVFGSKGMDKREVFV